MIKANTESQITVILTLLLALLAILIMVLAGVPPVSRDALVHHLAVPKLWIGHGGIFEMPDKVFSYYPMTIDLLYLVPLYFGNDIAPKFIHFAFALATSLIIYRYLKKKLNVNYALLGILLFLSTPIIVKLSITAYVDLGLVFFTTAAFMLILKWREDITRLTYLVLAAIMGGLALGTKYNGLITLLLFMLLVALIAVRGTVQGRQASIRFFFYIVIFGVVAALIYAPWGIRNIIWTGNPIYPLFDHWFNPSSPYESTTVPPIVLRRLLYGETWWEILLIPLRIFFQGMDDSPQYFDGRMNPALLILPVLALIPGAGKKNGNQANIEKGFMFIFSILFILFVFFKTSMRIRYVAPVIPILIMLSMFGLHNIISLVRRQLRGDLKWLATGLSLMILGLPFSLNAGYVVDQFRVVKPLQYLSGNISRDAYIEAFRPEYAVINHANSVLPADAKVLALFIGNRGYYSEREMVFGAQILEAALDRAENLEMLQAHLADSGITHLLIRFDMFADWRHNNSEFRKNELVSELLSSQRALLYSKNGHGLYQLDS